MLTVEFIKSLFDYEAATGDLIWKPQPFNKFHNEAYAKRWHTLFEGKAAGCLSVSKNSGIAYKSVKLLGKNHRAHRLVWAHQKGVMPVGDIDHIDGDGMNNRIENLRCVDRGENSRNARLCKRNTSGVCGVHRHKGKDYWRSVINKDGKRILLGHYKDFFEAVCARKSAERRLGFSERHGR